MLFFTLFSLLFLPILSLKDFKPKLCINCKYFIKDELDSKFGKCLMFPKKEEKNVYTLVNGVHINKNKGYHYCSTVRNINTLCGEEGKMYKKKYKKIKSKLEE
jgi:hypothetical protein